MRVEILGRGISDLRGAAPISRQAPQHGNAAKSPRTPSVPVLPLHSGATERSRCDF